MYKAVISGVGSYLPAKRITNADLEQLVSLTDDWIVSRTGIKERRVSEDSEATSDLAYPAALEAVQNAGIDPADLDMIVVATETPDHILPPVACQIQHKLGCGHISALDVHSTCVGFLSALQIAEQYIKLGTHRHILVVGADTLTKITDYSDPYTSILFGDGAGAAVISRGGEAGGAGIISTLLRSDGECFGALFVPGGGSRYRASEEHKAKMVMDGSKIFKTAVNTMTSGSEEVLLNSGYTKKDVDWFIPHQANGRIIDAVARNLSVPEEKMIKTVRYLGNSCSATIPTALCMAVKDGRIKRGDTLLMTAFGAGAVWGAALVQY
ncbi:3-oxoacyl-ACP synthase III family protein [Paenibacillus beijingensis]|uniref:Beta-ketoacyl-[acyl-carrier-protein] synthase III n=1 Tax=Paenibacillus beijingensis TaxID=1126833 RepID=A0A0D5NPY8_9BACL|nr:beta-ketoacyl-ACP synthase III [Paenibacillus beijingensis]AJY77321.1 3-oxoacyl-ACP synthase [Paenibacillus beijingensis]